MMKCPFCKHKLIVERKQFFCPQCKRSFTSKINWFRFILSFVYATIILRFITEVCRLFQVGWFIEMFIFIVILVALIYLYKVYLDAWFVSIKTID